MIGSGLSTNTLCRAAFTLGLIGTVARGANASEPGDAIHFETFDMPDSAVKAVRIEAVIEAPVSAVMAVFADVQQYPQWVHNCSRAELVSTKGFYDFTAYQISDMPWPVTDRDMVLKFRTEETATGGFHVELINQSSALPSTDNIRVSAAQGFYHFEPLSASSTLLKSEQHFDPSGNIPVWLMNQLLKDIPVRSVIGMRKLAQAPGYRSRTFKRDARGRIVGWTDSPPL